MNKQLAKFTSLILVSTMLGINNATLAQNQVDPMAEVEKDNCDKTVEVNYRSQKLTSTDGNTTIYFEGILRRVGKKGSYKDKDGEYCLPPDGRQTPVTTMIIENQGNVKRVSFPDSKDSYVVSNPVSFSSDMKYFIDNYVTGYDGGDREDSYVIYDILKRQVFPASR